MRLFEIGYSDGEATNFVVCTPIVDSDWFYLCWSLGHPFEKEILEPIIYHVDGKADIEDFPCTNADQFLISYRAFNILKAANSKFDAYQSVLIKEDGTEVKGYYTVNFTESFSCFHRGLTKFHLDEDGFVKFDGPKTYDKTLIPKGPEIFRTKDGIEILVTEDFRNKIRLGGVTGMGFKEVKVA